eukprot:COSAG05_NODE_600_length_8422_cov_35.108615_7_plen_87_part_00
MRLYDYFRGGAGIGKGPGLEQTAAEAAILLEESRAMALEVAALKAQQSRAPSSEAKAAPTSNSGLVCLITTSHVLMLFVLPYGGWL